MTTKTPGMRARELEDPARRDIRDILAEAVAEAGTVRGAAERLGMDKAQLSRWINRLGGDVQSRVVYPEQT